MENILWEVDIMDSVRIVVQKYLGSLKSLKMTNYEDNHDYEEEPISKNKEKFILQHIYHSMLRLDATKK